MYVMFDSITLSEIPRTANAVAGYTSGNWPTYNQVVVQWPHAHHLSIAVSASHDADCLDIEAGDATPDQGPAWVRRQHARGISRPAVYGSQSVIAAIVAALEHDGITRQQYRIWSAHYTHVPHICGPSEGVVQCDATQWTDEALGRNLDESLCASDFFSVPKAPNPLDVLIDSERRLANSLMRYLKHPHEHAHGLHVTRQAIVRARQEVWLAAVKGRLSDGTRVPKGWGLRNRQARYAELWRLSAL